MKIINDTQIVRTYDAETYELGVIEWEIPVAYKVEELYSGSGEEDDPDHCEVNQHVKVLEDVGPFRQGDLLQLTEDERVDLEDEVLQTQ